MDSKTAIARVLVEEHGADVTLRGKFDALAPALHRASEMGHLSIMKLLLDHGADVNSRDCISHTALHHSGSKPENLVRFLLDAGADPNAASNMSETLYMPL